MQAGLEVLLGALPGVADPEEGSLAGEGEGPAAGAMAETAEEVQEEVLEGAEPERAAERRKKEEAEGQSREQQRTTASEHNRDSCPSWESFVFFSNAFFSRKSD